MGNDVVEGVLQPDDGGITCTRVVRRPDDVAACCIRAMCAAEEALAGARAADALSAATEVAARKAADPLTKRKLSRKARLPTALSPVRPAREPPSLGTASALRSEVQMVRSTCKHADLVMERAERVHDEVYDSDESL